MHEPTCVHVCVCMCMLGEGWERILAGPNLSLQLQLGLHHRTGALCSSALSTFSPFPCSSLLVSFCSAEGILTAPHSASPFASQSPHLSDRQEHGGTRRHRLTAGLAPSQAPSTLQTQIFKAWLCCLMSSTTSSKLSDQT